MGYNFNYLSKEDSFSEIVDFAKENYPSLKEVSKDEIMRWFKKYQDFTVVVKKDDNLIGFGVYQEWPNCLYIIGVCFPNTSKCDNIRIMLGARKILPNKRLVWWDEEEMKAKGVRWQE